MGVWKGCGKVRKGVGIRNSCGKVWNWVSPNRNRLPRTAQNVAQNQWRQPRNEVHRLSLEEPHLAQENVTTADEQDTAA